MHAITKAARQVAALSCVMLALAGNARAQQSDTETRSIQVSLKGIDLGSPAGQDQARIRIMRAVHRIYSGFDSGSIMVSSDAIAEDASTAAAMNRLQVLTAAATQAAPSASFTVASSAPVQSTAASIEIEPTSVAAPR